MDDISNRTLALLLVTAIVVSLGATVYTLNILSTGRLPTGRAPTDQGNISLEVEQDLSIILSSDIVDFGTGFVNTTAGSHVSCQTNATLTAGDTYDDRNDCWTASEQPTHLELYNDGNINVSLTVLGPTKDDFFSDEATVHTKNISWKFRNNETDACTENVTAALSYQDFDGTAQSICNSLRFIPNDQDSLAIDIQVVIAADLVVGTYENSTIEFEATTT